MTPVKPKPELPLNDEPPVLWLAISIPGIAPPVALAVVAALSDTIVLPDVVKVFPLPLPIRMVTPLPEMLVEPENEILPLIV